MVVVAMSLKGQGSENKRQHEEHDRADLQVTLVHPPTADADGRGLGGEAGDLDDRQIPGRDLHRNVPGAQAVYR